MKKWRVTWYNMEQVHTVDPEPVTGETEELARRNAYLRYSGNPPAQFVMLEEIKS